MTTIVYKDGEFAWDSQSTWMSTSHLGCNKVHDRGGVIFGVSGSGRTSDVLEFMDIPARNTYDPEYDPRKWIITELVPAIKDASSRAGILVNNEGKTATDGMYVILYVDGLAGYLTPGGSFVIDESGLLGVGSGSDYALGAIKAGSSLERAVEIAIELDMYSGGKVKTLKVEETK